MGYKPLHVQTGGTWWRGHAESQWLRLSPGLDQKQNSASAKYSYGGAESKSLLEDDAGPLRRERGGPVERQRDAGTKEGGNGQGLGSPVT